MHAKTIPTKNVALRDVQITPEGLNHITDSGLFSEVDVIFCSTEARTFQTAKLILEKTEKKITQYSEFDELRRDKVGFLSNEEFEKSLKFSLENLDDSINKWETANSALERFTKKINELDSKFECKNILIVSHGLILNLYFAKLLNKINEAYVRHSNAKFCFFGIVKNGKVVRDIVD